MYIYIPKLRPSDTFYEFMSNKLLVRFYTGLNMKSTIIKFAIATRWKNRLKISRSTIGQENYISK